MAGQVLEGGFWKIGLYIRLSREDGSADGSESIKNQEKILFDFVREYFEPETCAVSGVFSDDGISGTDTNRPGFLALCKEVLSGRINCVIVKSLARAFRNLADQQKFLEEFIPVNRARFISAGTPFIDTLETRRQAGGLELPIRGLFNEQYAAAASEEIRKTFNMKRERGEFIGAFAPYGYVKDSKIKGRLAPDPEAAGVVRAIFEWFLEGMSCQGIAKRLNQLGILSPGQYKRSCGLSYYNPASLGGEGLWSPGAVTRILKNEVYTGTMVQGRQKIISYKVHKQVAVPKKDWYVVPNTHPPIVDRHIFDEAAGLFALNARTPPGKRLPQPLSGLVKCADCHASMRRKTARGIAYYSCRSYSDKGVCSSRSVREDFLISLALTVINDLIGLFDSVKTLERLSSSQKGVGPAGQGVSGQPSARAKAYQAALDSLKLERLTGEISEAEYQRLSERAKRQLSLLNAAEQAPDNRSYDPIGDERAELFSELIRTKRLPRLTRGLLTRLILSVRVERDGGVTVYLGFKNELLTPKEQDRPPDAK